MKELVKDKSLEGLKEFVSKSNYPMYSVHIPGDYNSVSYLLDEYQDCKIWIKYCKEKMQQNQVEKKDQIRKSTKAYIKFT